MKFLRVTMTERSIQSEAVPQAYLGLGGRGLIALFINAEVAPL